MQPVPAHPQLPPLCHVPRPDVALARDDPHPRGEAQRPVHLVLPVKQGVAGERVAVVGWGWYQSIEGIKARRMVVVREWQWQYWQSCECLKKVAVDGWQWCNFDNNSRQWHNE
jgi:hypothetical protein